MYTSPVPAQMPHAASRTMSGLSSLRTLLLLVAAPCRALGPDTRLIVDALANVGVNAAVISLVGRVAKHLVSAVSLDLFFRQLGYSSNIVQGHLPNEHFASYPCPPSGRYRDAESRRTDRSWGP